MSLGSASSVVDTGERLKMDGGSGGRTGSLGKRRGAKLGELMESLSRAYNENIGQALGQHEYNFVLSDPRLPDHPIVFASDGFLRMSGYDREEVLGRNCRFLQGPDTDRGTVVEIRDAIREERACQTPIANDLASETLPVELPSENMAKESSAQVDSSETADQSSVNTRSRGGAETEEDEDEAAPSMVNDAVRQKASLAIQRVTGELTQSSRVKGELVQNRCIGLSESAANGVVNSSLMLSLTRIQQSLVLADPSLPDTPIVHASDVFCELTGYSREEVVGRNCRFLQGPETDPETVREIREAIEAERPCTVRILNYRKDNTPFWNHLHVAPVRSAKGKVAYYLGVQLDVSDADMPLRGDSISANAKQLSAVGIVRVAVRSLQGSGLRRILKTPGCS